MCIIHGPIRLQVKYMLAFKIFLKCMHVQVSLLVHLKNCIVHYDYTLWQIVYYNFVSIYNIVHYIYLLKFHE